MIFTHSASVGLPLSAIHLDEWLFNLSEKTIKHVLGATAPLEPMEALTSMAWSMSNRWLEL